MFYFTIFNIIRFNNGDTILPLPFINNINKENKPNKCLLSNFIQ